MGFLLDEGQRVLLVMQYLQYSYLWNEFMDNFDDLEMNVKPGSHQFMVLCICPTFKGQELAASIVEHAKS